MMKSGVRKHEPVSHRRICPDGLAGDARSCDACVWLPAVGLGTAMIHPLIRRLHTLQMHGSPDSMRPLGGSGGEHRADKVH